MTHSSEPHVSDTEQDAFEMKWSGRFDQLVGKAQKLWGDVTNDIVDQAEGSARSLVGKIKEKTGETVENIERKLNEEE